MEIKSDQTGTVDNSNLNQEGAAGAADQAAEQIVDLDGLSSFKYQGNTYTPDQLLDIFQGYQKYGETSAYVSEDEKYWSNVFVDIEKVVRDPNLTDAFKQTYPKRFHAFLDRELNRSQQGQGSARQPGESPESKMQLPPELMEKLNRVDAMEQYIHRAEVEAASAKIDALLPPLLQKYELADEDKVLMAAEKLLSRGQKLTDAAWERLVREDHERTQKRADKVYEAKLKSQLKKGEEGRDTGPGGATPGQAPVKPRTFAEAQAAMIASMRNK